jgi:outer membrane lipoprotein SlyB
MELVTTKSMHPLTAIAAVSVTLFSLAGIGAITGLIPTSHSQPVALQAAEPSKSAVAAPTAEPATIATKTAANDAAKEAAPKPAASKPAARTVKPVQQAAKPPVAPVAPVVAYTNEAPVKIAQNAPPAGYGPPPDYVAPPAKIEPAKPICHECGVIEAVREIEKKGEGSGLGAVAGGVAGGLLGRQTGGGRGRDVMTVLGAIGGAVAGNAVEKNVKKVKNYEVAIRFDDGSSRLITQDNPPAWRSGDRVKIVDGMIVAHNG